MFSPDYEGIEAQQILAQLLKYLKFSPDYEGIEVNELAKYLSQRDCFLPTMREFEAF